MKPPIVVCIVVCLAVGAAGQDLVSSSLTDQSATSIERCLAHPGRRARMTRLHLEYARYAVGGNGDFWQEQEPIIQDACTPDWLQTEILLLKLRDARIRDDPTAAARAVSGLLARKFLSPSFKLRRDVLCIREINRIFFTRKMPAKVFDHFLNVVLSSSEPEVGLAYLFLFEQRARCPVDRANTRDEFFLDKRKAITYQLRRGRSMSEWYAYILFLRHYQRLDLAGMTRTADSYVIDFGTAGDRSQEICYRMLNAIRMSRSKRLNPDALRKTSEDVWLRRSLANQGLDRSKNVWATRIDAEFAASDRQAIRQ